DRLEPLLAHHRADAVLRRDVAVIALDRREAHALLAGHADRVDGQLVTGKPQLEVQRVLRFPRVLAEQRTGVAQLEHVVVDVQVYPVLGLSLDDDGVVAAVLEVRPEEAVRLGRRRSVRARADRDDGERARAPHRQPGERTGGEDQPVVGMVPRRVALPARGLTIEDHGAEPDAADLLAHLLRAPRLGPAFLAREVHAQELAGVGARKHGLGLRLLGRSSDRDGCHTATGVVPGAFEGRPSTVSGSNAPVVLAAMNAGLMSKGFRRRWSLKRTSDTPLWTRPLSIPTSFVVQMSLDGPRMIAPVNRSPVNSSLR